jgi:hypothetical protein
MDTFRCNKMKQKFISFREYHKITCGVVRCQYMCFSHLVQKYAVVLWEYNLTIITSFDLGASLSWIVSQSPCVFYWWERGCRSKKYVWHNYRKGVFHLTRMWEKCFQFDSTKHRKIFLATPLSSHCDKERLSPCSDTGSKNSLRLIELSSMNKDKFSVLPNKSLYEAKRVYIYTWKPTKFPHAIDPR